MRPVNVTIIDHAPASFLWKKQQVNVAEIADQWREAGRWWDGEGLCEFFLITAATGSFLLCREVTTDRWYAKPVQ